MILTTKIKALADTDSDTTRVLTFTRGERDGLKRKKNRLLSVLSYGSNRSKLFDYLVPSHFSRTTE